MKKLLILSAMCMAMTAQATVLRVSNVTNSGAPYSTISAALETAIEGDTIMVDGSPDNYELTNGITKRIVLIGPGYFLTENSTQATGSAPAIINSDLSIVAEAAGSIIQGMTLNKAVTISATNVVITRCMVNGVIKIGAEASNTIIHQNYITNFTGGDSEKDAPYHVQITNNIITAGISTNIIHFIKESHIAYNTFTGRGYGDTSTQPFNGITNCVVENNFFTTAEKEYTNCTFANNYWTGSTYTAPYSSCKTDLEVKNKELSEEVAAAIVDKGAFAGDDPYVISGVPAGPMIKDITVPASVEQGKTLNVTIKLGIQK